MSLDTSRSIDSLPAHHLRLDHLLQAMESAKLRHRVQGQRINRLINCSPWLSTIYLSSHGYGSCERRLWASYFRYPVQRQELPKYDQNYILLHSSVKVAGQSSPTLSKPFAILSLHNAPISPVGIGKDGDLIFGKAHLWTGKRSGYKRIAPRSPQAACHELWTSSLEEKS